MSNNSLDIGCILPTKVYITVNVHKIVKSFKYSDVLL